MIKSRVTKLGDIVVVILCLILILGAAALAMPG